MKRLLAQLQLSNYDSNGKFILEADSGYQMVANRVKVMLDINPDLEVTLIGPKLNTMVTFPWDINPTLWNNYSDRVKYVEIDIVPNALATRYNFDLYATSKAIGLPHVTYDAAYINDPMLLRHYKAMFHLTAKKQPKFYVHSHFVDVPSCPKFPVDASLWLGQLEAAIKADWNFWQCESALAQFIAEAKNVLNSDVVDAITEKSTPWDDGYSIEEINSPVDVTSLRFDPLIFIKLKAAGKKVIFVPNRVGGKGRSSDYTNCGKFLFDILPALHSRRDDYVVIAGNPNQKFSNDELLELCGRNGYINLTPDAFTRDEYKFVASKSDFVVGLYNADLFGATATRECVDLRCLPLWLDFSEYATILRATGMEEFLIERDFSNVVDVISRALDTSYVGMDRRIDNLVKFVRDRCSYEKTTSAAMVRMQLL